MGTGAKIEIVMISCQMFVESHLGGAAVKDCSKLGIPRKWSHG